MIDFLIFAIQAALGAHGQQQGGMTTPPPPGPLPSTSAFVIPAFSSPYVAPVSSVIQQASAPSVGVTAGLTVSNVNVLPGGGVVAQLGGPTPSIQSATAQILAQRIGTTPSQATASGAILGNAIVQNSGYAYFSPKGPVAV